MRDAVFDPSPHAGSTSTRWIHQQIHSEENLARCSGTLRALLPDGSEETARCLEDHMHMEIRCISPQDGQTRIHVVTEPHDHDGGQWIDPSMRLPSMFSLWKRARQNLRTMARAAEHAGNLDAMRELQGIAQERTWRPAWERLATVRLSGAADALVDSGLKVPGVDERLIPRTCEGDRQRRAMTLWNAALILRKRLAIHVRAEDDPESFTLAARELRHTIAAAALDDVNLNRAADVASVDPPPHTPDQGGPVPF